jgi:tetratricopeptide (TPR) repeat protein
MATDGKLFVSHSSKDDGFVLGLQQMLELHGVPAWIDSRELRPGGLLDPDIAQAIDTASAFAVVVTPTAFQSKWVAKELRLALDVQRRRGREAFPVFALLLDGTGLGAFEAFFDSEPINIEFDRTRDGIETAVNPILVALGKRLPADTGPTPQPKAEPLEELVLELTDLKIYEEDGKRRASARARLVYEPANPAQREVASAKSWRFTAPLGPIEAEELRWYLEKYAIWPSRHFVERARKVENNLIEWGRSLHGAALPLEHTANVLQAWARIDGRAGRRFSVLVNNDLEAGAAPADEEAAREAATRLLGLPWELLHDGEGFLFQGAKPARVRRRLPNTKVLDVPAVAPPIRVLLVTARPEDEACGYLDHRASALPLVEAMEALGGLVHLHVLSPPTFDALGRELDRAREAGRPYHVVHFDGHGVYDRRVGLGGLCFEDPRDSGKLERRRHLTVYTDRLGELLREHRIPLVFLEACQTAQAEQASESVASELLKVGVASVVAMSHSVLVETARRFVEAFYAALAEGRRVGDAMLAGQRGLKDDSYRGRVFGAGPLRLEDWFVPVLFQEKDDPRLFRAPPSGRTREDVRAALKARLGELPDPPETGFVGRSRELLALQRLLAGERYAVLRGQGGEGKTALAVEFARWLVRSRQARRAVFVSVETHGHAAAVLDAIGRQLVPGYSVAAFPDREQALLPVERALAEQATLLVVDNLESVLLPPFVETPEALSEDLRRELGEILALCARLIGGKTAVDHPHPGPLPAGEGVNRTRLVFTSREALPAPFAGERNRIELHRLAVEDAVKLVEQALGLDVSIHAPEGANLEEVTPLPNKFYPPEGGGFKPARNLDDGDELADARREEIEALANAVHGHARTLTLLVPALRSRGVEATRLDLVALMVDMERRYPGSREQSVFASVELSLRRMSAANRERARVLGVFQGGVDLDALRVMTEWEEADVAALAVELIETGLATVDPYNHLTLNPALCPYLRSRLDEAERTDLEARWVDAMRGYIDFLVQQDKQKAEIAQTLTGLELPNLFALLDRVRNAGDAEATIGLATSLYSLLQMTGKLRLLERVGQVRDAAAVALGETWNHARFEAQRTRIGQQLASGQLRESLEEARDLLQRARAMGTQAYSEANYDQAMAYWLLACALKKAGGSEQALPLLDEARRCFEAYAKERASKAAEGMAGMCFAERGGCLILLGRLDEAAAAYEESISRAKQLGDERAVAVGQGQLGTVRLNQRRYPEALAAYGEARERFARLDEPGTVAVIWHQTGRVYQDAGQPEAAEDAYRKSLAIKVRLGDVAGQASTLGQLGILYGGVLSRTEEAVAFFRQAADKYIEIGDLSSEGKQKNNLAIELRKLRRLDEARQEIRRAIECKAQFGHASEPWTSWAILADIETDTGNITAAAEAKRKAIECYLAYRRDGGENHDPSGRVALAVTEALRAGDAAGAAAFLQELAARPDAVGSWPPYIQALQAIVAGRRDSALAAAPELHYTMAAEILFLIETLAAREH